MPIVYNEQPGSINVIAICDSYPRVSAIALAIMAACHKKVRILSGGDSIRELWNELPSLDGLRAISITLVILSHLVKWRHVSLDVLGSYGALGVHVFLYFLDS